MKKLTTIIIAIALFLGMNQCKKNVETIATTPSSLGEPVNITVNIGDGGKHIVYPGTGAYVFENGDKLYVGNNGKFIGTLEYNSGAFSGTIYGPSTEDYLHFYFVGGLTPSDEPMANTTTDFNVDISDQSGNLPVLSYAHSTQKYVDGTTTYGCILLNKCALVKFGLADGTSDAVTVSNLLTEATINFGTPGITPKATTGTITLYPQSETAKWAILLPGTDLSIATTSGTITFEGDVPAVTDNGYITSGITITATPTPVEPVFSVSSTKTVHFSSGNLQYKSGEGWRFAPNQYDCVGSWDASDWVDLFGWGTWGDGKNPINESTDYNDYQWSTDFEGTLDGHNDWYTLSTEEWQYLFSHSTYGMATVNSVRGIIILPDNSSLNINTAHNGWDNNIYDASSWTIMETSGVVFLPAAGNRYGTGVFDVGVTGNYWSATPYDGDNAWYVLLLEGWVGPDSHYYRNNGQCVRLVR